MVVVLLYVSQNLQSSQVVLYPYKSSCIPMYPNVSLFAEATVDKVEGRKVFMSAALKTVNGDVTYANSTALFVIVK